MTNNKEPLPPRVWISQYDLREKIPYGLPGAAMLEAELRNHQKPQDIPFVPESLLQEKVAEARAGAFEEAVDTVDRMRTQHEVMAGFGTTAMAALLGMAKAARAGGGS